MLTMQKYTIEILVVPTILETQLTGKQIERKVVTIEGYTLKDAKKRAGIN